jgi:hypothetical protein
VRILALWEAALRLNGWQRIGVVASVVWILIVLYAAWDGAAKKATSRYTTAYRECIEAPNSDWDRCATLTRPILEKHPPYKAFLEEDESYVAPLALLPVALGWLIAYGLVALVRWIRAGF